MAGGHHGGSLCDQAGDLTIGSALWGPVNYLSLDPSLESHFPERARGGGSHLAWASPPSGLGWGAWESSQCSLSSPRALAPGGWGCGCVPLSSWGPGLRSVWGEGSRSLGLCNTGRQEAEA